MKVETAGLAVSTVRNYRCARCWGRLVADDLDVHCFNPDCDGEGFVTADYVEARLAENAAEKMEAMHNLGELLNIKKKKRTEKEILDELGI